MAFSGNYMCTSFKQELLEGAHNFKNSGGDTFKLAMYETAPLLLQQQLPTQLLTK